MDDIKFIKYWLPIIGILFIINTIPLFIEGDQTLFQIPIVIIMWSMVAIQLLDLKYKFKLLN